jgi:hypothetical protein
VTNRGLLCWTVKKTEFDLPVIRLLEATMRALKFKYLTSQIFILYHKFSVLVSGECFFEDTANGDVAAVYFLVNVRPVIFKCFLQETMLVGNVTSV